MAFSSSISDFLNSMLIATEAEDITQQTANEVRSAIGGATPSTTQDPDGEGEDLMQVDNIFTQAPGENNNGSDPSPSGNPEDDQNAGMEEMPPEDGTEEGDPNATSESQDPNLTQDPNQNFDNPIDGGDDLLFAQKDKVRDNLVQLYTIISNDIKTLVESLNHVEDTNSVQVINAVLNHLRNSKDFLYKTLTVNLKELDYEELLQRYITIRRVYDVCVKMLQTHFEEEHADDKK